MILTDKAREDFLIWYFNNYLKNAYVNIKNIGSFFETLHDTFKNALIIDWLDSVCVFINIIPSIPIGYEYADCFNISVNTNTYRDKYKTRQEATKQAIIKANEIYNEKYI